MDMTPVLIGVGEDFETTPEGIQSARSNVDLAANAARSAIADAGVDLSAAVDTIVAVRTYPDSTPFWPHPIIGATNFARAVARRVGVAPRYAAYETVGGHTPQKLVGEFAARLVAGAHRLVLIAGGDAIATEKAAQRAGVSLDWSDAADGETDDRGFDVATLVSAAEIENDLVEIGAIYALFEQARRARYGLSREDYAREIGDLFAPFSRIAAATEGALVRRAMSPAEIAAAGGDNPMMFDPLTRAAIAKDGVNMGAAVLLTTLGTARALGVREEKLVYLRGHCDTIEKPLLDRPHLDRSPALSAAYEHAMARASAHVDDVRHLDFYNCFPIAVFLAREAMGLPTGDPRPLTMTGGLPFFGGPGNNYSMHALAAMVRMLRKDRESLGVIGANGGFLTKHAVGVYGASPPPAPWSPGDDRRVQAALDATPSADWTTKANGEASIETYTVTHRRGAPHRAHVVGRLKSSGVRFLAVSDETDLATPQAMAARDPLGATIRALPAARGNRFAF